MNAAAESNLSLITWGLSKELCDTCLGTIPWEAGEAGILSTNSYSHWLRTSLTSDALLSVTTQPPSHGEGSQAGFAVECWKSLCGPSNSEAGHHQPLPKKQSGNFTNRLDTGASQ
jgi:hypothetical protein